MLFLVAAGAFAATPVATVKSSVDFELRGAIVHTAGVPSWPVMPGDVIVAGESSAVVHLSDGSRVNLTSRSRVKIEENKDGLAVRLLQGAMGCVPAKKTTTLFYSGANVVKAAPEIETMVSTPGARGVKTEAFLPPPPPPPLSRY